MAAHNTQYQATPITPEPRDDRRGQRRVTPPWHVEVALKNGLRYSAAIGDVSIRTFQIQLRSVIHLGTEVQFFMSENTKKYLGGRALKGEAIVSVVHAKGVVFEFQDFRGHDFDRFYEALLRYVEDPNNESV